MCSPLLLSSFEVGFRAAGAPFSSLRLRLLFHLRSIVSIGMGALGFSSRLELPATLLRILGLALIPLFREFLLQTVFRFFSGVFSS